MNLSSHRIVHRLLGVLMEMVTMPNTAVVINETWQWWHCKWEKYNQVIFLIWWLLAKVRTLC